MYKIIAVSSSTTELDIAAKRLQRVARRFLAHLKKIDVLLFALCNTPSSYIIHKQITEQKVEEILNEKKNLNVKSPEGKTLLHLAAESQRLDLIMLLLRAEPQLAIDGLEKDLEVRPNKELSCVLAQINAINKKKSSTEPLECPISRENIFEMRDPVWIQDTTNGIGNFYKRESIEKYLELGHTKSPITRHPISKEAIQESELIKRDSLFSRAEEIDGNDLNKTDYHGRTILMEAISYGDIKTLELLADKVDFTMPDNNGKTPLHHLVEMENLKAIDFLIGKGVDFNVPDQSGQTIAHFSVIHGNVKVVQCLMDKGVDFKVKDQDGKTPAHYAANSGNREIIECLWDNGVDFREPDIEENTPLQIVFRDSFKDSRELFEELYGAFFGS